MACGRAAHVAALQEGEKLLIPGHDVVDREQRSSTGCGLAKVLLPLALVAAIAVAGLRWSGSTGRPDKADVVDALGLARTDAGQASGSDRVGADVVQWDAQLHGRIIPVKRQCTLFKGVGQWVPIVMLLPGWSVLTSGRANSDQMVVQEVRDDEAQTVEGVSGVVQTSCLQLNAGSGAGATSDSHDSNATHAHMLTYGVAPPAPDVPTTPEAPTSIRHKGGSSHSDSDHEAGVVACEEVRTTRGYTFCKNSYCGQDAKIETRMVSNVGDCIRLCNASPKCRVMEISGRNNKECTLRPACDHPVVSTLGTAIAFKV